MLKENKMQAMSVIRTEFSKKIPDLELVLDSAEGDETLTSYVESHLEDLGILDRVKKMQKYFYETEAEDDVRLRWVSDVAWGHPILQPYYRALRAKLTIERAVEGLVKNSENPSRNAIDIKNIMEKAREELKDNKEKTDLLMYYTEPHLKKMLDYLASEGIFREAEYIARGFPNLEDYLKKHKDPLAIINSTFEKSYKSKSKEERAKLYDSALRFAIFEEPKGDGRKERDKERQEELLIFILDLINPEYFFRNIEPMYAGTSGYMREKRFPDVDAERYEEIVLRLRETSRKLQYASKSFFEGELDDNIEELEEVYREHQPENFEFNYFEENQQQELKEFKEFLKDRRMI
jgi:hypothetical protein